MLVLGHFLGQRAYLLSRGSKHAGAGGWLPHLHPRAGGCPRVRPLRGTNEGRPLHPLKPGLLPCVPRRGLPPAALRNIAQPRYARLQCIAKVMTDAERAGSAQCCTDACATLGALYSNHQFWWKLASAAGIILWLAIKSGVSIVTGISRRGQDPWRAVQL